MPPNDREPEHAVDDCVGKWSVEPGIHGPEIYCRYCGARCSATEKRTDRALRENWTGALLDVLVNQGVLFLKDGATGN